VTAVAFVAMTVNVDEAPGPIEGGAAVIETVVVNTAVTVTVAVAEALVPVAPVAVAV
jgi:hypothetical protein